MTDQVAIVTGGSRGIGRAISRLLAARGYAVAVNYTGGATQAASIVDEILSAGGRAEAIRADVADPDAVAGLFDAAERALGPVTALVANAGIAGTPARVDAQTPDELRRLLDVNVFGAVLSARQAVRRMSTRHGGKGGAIVFTSSVAARTGGAAGLAVYAATKGAIESFTRGLAAEIGREGVRVNAVAPGIVDTDMVHDALREAALSTPIGRIGVPQEIAEAVFFLLSPAASFITGSVLTASGGR